MISTVSQSHSLPSFRDFHLQFKWVSGSTQQTVWPRRQFGLFKASPQFKCRRPEQKGEKRTLLEKFQIRNLIFVVVVVLPFMFMYLVLFAALALKMRSSTFQGASSEMRVEGKFLDKYLTSFTTWRVSFIPSTGNAIHAERGEEPLGVAGNRWWRAPTHRALSRVWTLWFYFFACLNIRNLELSKLENLYFCSFPDVLSVEL